MHLPAAALLLHLALYAQDPATTLTPQTPTQPIAPPAAMALIQQKQLLAHATYLASDELGGRLTGSPGQELAARYIADHFTRLGLEPLGDVVDGKTTFVQHYGITRTTVTPDSRLHLGSLELRDGFAILGARPTAAKVEGTLRFVGLGRTRGDAAEVGDAESLADTIPVVLVKSPRGRLDRALTVEEKFGMSFQSFGQLGKTTKNLAGKGAGAVLYLQVADPMGLSDVLNYLSLAPGKDALAARFPGAEDSGMGMMASVLGGNSEALSIVLSVPASAAMMAQLELAPETVTKFLAGEGDAPQGRNDLPAKLQVTITHDDQAVASNIVAVLRGSDPLLADEAIVYTAHMDHVGKRMDGEVFNGADDNASGSAGLLEIAAAYANSQQKPRRSIVFLAVSGEEMGLWGSAYYCDHPTWPIAKIVADINTDMIGRSGPESAPLEVTVTPSNTHERFSTLVRDAAGLAAELGVTFRTGDKYYARSDHIQFAKKGIPVLFFCNGEHEDYHQVTDHADKLDGAKMERIARLAFWTGWNVANADEKPRVLGRQKAWR